MLICSLGKLKYTNQILYQSKIKKVNKEETTSSCLKKIIIYIPSSTLLNSTQYFSQANQ